MKPIVLLSCVGTLVSAIVIAVILELVKSAGLTGSFQPRFTELLTFGALISATDPVSTLAVFQAKRVDPQLFYLVFGESVLNDAVGLVLFNVFQKFVTNENSFGKVMWDLITLTVDFLFIFVGSLCLGLISGVLAALLLKKVDMRHTALLEVSLYVLVMYLPFFLADVLHLSGIVTILFTGISAKHFAEPNLSDAASAEADSIFRVTAHLAETAIFLELGLSVFGLAASYGNFHWQFVLWSMLACLAGRAANVYPIVALYNRTLWITPGRQRQLTYRRQSNDGRGKGGGEGRGGEGDSSPTSPEFTIPNMERSLPDTDSRSLSEISATDQERRDQKIEMSTANMLWFSGLRGAVAYACAKTFPDTFGELHLY